VLPLFRGNGHGHRHTTANKTTDSGFSAKKGVELWASWPASSPWVTAVGATRFVGQKVGNAEMATDQFGSGGGFSKMFDQSKAQWQVAAVAKYLKTVDASTLPPSSA
jgi:subtilase family serine protease